MCGIVGIIKRSKLDFVEELEVKKMTSMLSLRGPDTEGIYVYGNIGLGHRRLSIIDVEGGNQPIFTSDRSIVIVFNGMIYNYLELRKQLIDVGIVFSTNTDTEILVHGYQVWGIDKLLEKIEGTFAFAIHDVKREIVYLIRDRFGEKPIFYHTGDNALFFASELKAFEHQIKEKKISKQGLNLFLSLSYIPSPFTIYENVCKLSAGHYLVIKEGNFIESKQYYSLDDHIDKENKINFEEAKQQLDNLLKNSIKQKMLSDVPVGAFLSGGIDSSIVVGLMSQMSDKPINTFSIGFEEKSYDESQRAQVVADKFKTNHTLHYLNYNDVIDTIDSIIDYFDEPYGDSSAIPSFYVANLAKSKVKVVLTGDCADELFGGYEKYLAGYYARKWNTTPLFLRWFFVKLISLFPHTGYTSRMLRYVKKVVTNSALKGFDLHYSYMCLGFFDNEKKMLLNDNFLYDSKKNIEDRYNVIRGTDELNHGMQFDLDIVLEGDMFPKGDRCGMMNSIEERSPFFDYRMVHFASSLPSQFKIKGRNKKYILKETYKELLPKKTLKFKKSGFEVPIDLWFKDQLKDDMLGLLSKEKIMKQGIFQYDYILKLIDEHLKGKENHKGKLWNLYVFQKWYYKHYNEELY